MTNIFQSKFLIFLTKINSTSMFSFAFKKDGKGERHGSAAERLLAAQNPLSTSDRPHTMFADSPHLNNPMMNPMAVQVVFDFQI